MSDDRWWSGLDAVVAAVLPAGTRILDLGCGDGGLVDRLTERGFDALGVDPRAPSRPRLIRERVEHATGLGQFDAITATMALHHAELRAVVETVAALLRADGRLFVYELDWNAYDARSAAWLAEHDRSGADHSIGAWRREHGELHTRAAIEGALSAYFEPTLEVARPFLARMLGRHDLEAAEHALIDAQLLPALGFWYIARPVP
jgi:SAM-dependent methyltransferase